MTAIKKVNQGASPIDMPNGIPPLNSLMGEMLNSRTQAILLAIMCFQNSAVYDREA
jgi:hypothetical protein